MRGGGLIRRPFYLRRSWPIELAVCTTFRNEAPYLAEWIEFHHSQGVQRFFLYDNRSADAWREAVSPFADLVEVRQWLEHPGQLSAYGDCLRRRRWDTRWLAVIDVDEFLFSPTGRPLPEVLTAFPRVAAVAANWRCYGTSGHQKPPAGPVLASYTRRAPDDHPINLHVKSIVFPALTAPRMTTAHHFAHYGPVVGERRDPVTSPKRSPPTADLLRINHYYTRSAAEWAGKLAGPRPDAWPRDSIDIQLLNVVSDPILAGSRSVA